MIDIQAKCSSIGSQKVSVPTNGLMQAFVESEQWLPIKQLSRFGSA
jgi:hypothetical protein